MLKDAAQLVFAAREANKDVFVWPKEPWTLEYIHEEVTEWARHVQRDDAPEHARNNALDQDGELMEAGQTLMMVLTLVLQRNLDPDKALNMACGKIYTTAARKRAAAAGGVAECHQNAIAGQGCVVYPQAV